MKIIRFFLHYSRRTMILALGFGVVAGAADAALLAVINLKLRSQSSAPLSVLLAFIGLCAMVPVTRYLSGNLLIELAQNTLYDLRVALSKKILRIPLRNLELFGAARFLAVLTDDIPLITNTLLLMPVLCIDAAIVAGCLVFLGWLSWLVFLLVGAGLMVGIATYQLPIIKAQKLFKAGREEEEGLLRHFQALTLGIKELKFNSQRRASFMAEKLETAAGSFRRFAVAGGRTHTTAVSWGQTLVFIVIGLVLFAPFSASASRQVFTGYTLGILYMLGPLEVIMNMLPALGRANVALGKMEAAGLYLEENPGEHLVQMPVSSVPDWQKLELVNVTHRYRREDEANDFLLGPIHFHLRKGEMVFLAGGNGSGKTTLAKILTGLYRPESGAIQLDGVTITDETLDHFRHHFSTIFSDFYLFDDLRGISASDARIQHYLRQLGLEHKTQVVNGVFSTTALSQGQRKRLALLIAYLEDRSIYVFDEWAADQDPAFKNTFYLDLLPELKARGKTVLAISHDDRYYHIPDRVVKLEEGQIAEVIVNSPEIAGAAEMVTGNGLRREP